jgi:hypothetical protein
VDREVMDVEVDPVLEMMVVGVGFVMYLVRMVGSSCERDVVVPVS